MQGFNACLKANEALISDDEWFHAVTFNQLVVLLTKLAFKREMY